MKNLIRIIRPKKITVTQVQQPAPKPEALFENIDRLVNTAVDKLGKRCNWLETEIAKMQEELRLTEYRRDGLITARDIWEAEEPRPVGDITADMIDALTPQPPTIIPMHTESDGTYTPWAPRTIDGGVQG